MTIRIYIFFSAVLFAACGAGPKSDQSGPQGEASIEDGETLLEQGEWAAAAKLFEKIVSERPDSAKAHYYLGLAKKNLGDLEAAEQHYRLAIGYDADLSAAHNNLGLLLLENGDLVHAESELHTYLSGHLEEADANFNYGLIMEASGELEKAKEHYNKAAEIDPEDPAPWFGLGDLARRRGNLKEALANYRKGREIAPENTELALKEGQTLLDLKQLDKAAAVLDALPSFSQCDPGVLVTAGVLLAKFDEDDKAIALYRAAIERDENFASAHLLLGNALARKKRFKEAADHFERFLAIAPDAGEAAAVKARLQACKARMK
jgi:tetratricopeptide (TPR) repeat protein